MEARYLQNIRYKLQSRVRRLNQIHPNHFLYGVQKLLLFIEGTAPLSAVVAEVTAKEPEYAMCVDAIFSHNFHVGVTESEDAAIGYGVLKRYAKEDKHLQFIDLVDIRSGDLDAVLNRFRALYVTPLYEYMDERLDDASFVLYSLMRYKRLCEWFRRDDLYQQWNEDSRRGEKVLAYDLYRHLYENGVEVTIEPRSVSGEADMVALQSSKDPLVADAKIFNPEKGKGKPYIEQGFRQIYTYTCDYNQPIGYLVVFNTSEYQLRLALKNASEPVPRIVHNNKTIFLLGIDIFPHEKPASQRPAPRVVEVTEQDLTASGVETSDT